MNNIINRIYRIIIIIEELMIKQPTSRTCFLCGRQNDAGLKMKWYNNPKKNQIEAKITIPEHFNGYPGVTHGGIVAAILDETAGRAMMLDGNFDNLFVTLKLDVTYRQLTPTSIPLTAVGWILKKDERKVSVAAEIRLPNSTVTAKCKALVMEPPPEIAKRWEPERPYWRIEE